MPSRVLDACVHWVPRSGQLNGQINKGGKEESRASARWPPDRVNGLQALAGVQPPAGGTHCSSWEGLEAPGSPSWSSFPSVLSSSVNKLPMAPEGLLIKRNQ